ncbi:MAG: DUF1489 domain-containing protein [Proteobacteria bacterium]|nr:DUF1489 domain-containing protein [Pseudomonadota bacterium]
MPLHMMRLAVGVRDIEHLASIQKKRKKIQLPKRGGKAVPSYTTHMPKRAEELLDGGSLYWVIKGLMRVRQRLLGFRPYVDDEGRTRCMLLLDTTLVPTLPTAFRAFQGWRYFDPASAPADLTKAGKGAANMPPQMLAELRSLGLL